MRNENDAAAWLAAQKKDYIMAEIGNNTPYTFDRVVRILGGVLLLGVAVYLLNSLKGVLLPFFVAWLIAYMLEPVVKWNIRWMHCRKRFLPVVFTW